MNIREMLRFYTREDTVVSFHNNKIVMKRDTAYGEIIISREFILPDLSSDELDNIIYSMHEELEEQHKERWYNS